MSDETTKTAKTGDYLAIFCLTIGAMIGAVATASVFLWLNIIS